MIRSRTDDWYRKRLRLLVDVVDSGCWEFRRRHVKPTGYVTIAYQNRGWSAHRLSYHLFKGPIIDGMDVCHSCDNRRCVNPEHLWLGTQKQNMQDCIRKGRHHSQQRTHCPRGHEYTPENTYMKPPTKARPAGARICRACSVFKQRIRAGWSQEQAESMPIVPRELRWEFWKRSSQTRSEGG